MAPVFLTDKIMLERKSVVTIAATGQRFEKANYYPTYKTIEYGQPISLTTGFKGKYQVKQTLFKHINIYLYQY